MFIFIYFSEESFLYLNKFSIFIFTFLNGIFSTLIALGIIFALERFAGFVTQLKMLELLDPGTPLLRKLFECAPGTYPSVTNSSSAMSEPASGCEAAPWSDGVRLFVYTNPRGVGFHVPEFATFQDEWLRYRFYNRNWGKENAVGYDVDPSRSFQDYARGAIARC